MGVFFPGFGSLVQLLIGMKMIYIHSILVSEVVKKS